MTESSEAAYEKVTLAEMTVGQRGYTLPWASGRDSRGRLRLIQNYPVQGEPEGTFCVPVRRDRRGWVLGANTTYPSAGQASVGGSFPDRNLTLPARLERPLSPLQERDSKRQARAFHRQNLDAVERWRVEREREGVPE